MPGTEFTITSKKKTNPAADHAAEAAQREQDYAAAKALHEQDEQTYAAAVEHEAKVKADRASTPDDLARASAAAVLAEQRKAESAAALAQAERRLLNTSTDLADALAPLVADVLGVQPTCQPFTPPSPLPIEAEPVALLVQRKAAKLDRSGSLSGEVEVLLHRKRYHREMDAGAFQRHAERTGSASLSPYSGGTQEHDGVYLDTVRLHVSAVLPEVPTVAPGREERGLTNLRAQVAQQVAQRSTYMHSGPLSGGDTGKRQGVAVNSTARVVADSTRSGKRSLTVEATFTGWSTVVGTTWNLPTIREEIEQAAKALDGQAVADLGRVSSFEVLDVVMVEGAGVARTSGGTVMLGSPGSGITVDGIAVTVRFVLVQRAAEGEKRAAAGVPEQRQERALDDEALADRESGLRTHPGVRK